MKKLLFLISLCLLSQNFTIASESFGESTQPGVPVPVNTPVPSSAITEEISKKPPVVSSSSTPAQKQQTSTTILTKTLQKEVPPIATAATVNIAAAPVPAISAASAIKNVAPPVQKIRKPVQKPAAVIQSTKQPPVAYNNAPTPQEIVPSAPAKKTIAQIAAEQKAQREQKSKEEAQKKAEIAAIEASQNTQPIENKETKHVSNAKTPVPAVQKTAVQKAVEQKAVEQKAEPAQLPYTPPKISVPVVTATKEETTKAVVQKQPAPSAETQAAKAQQHAAQEESTTPAATQKTAKNLIIPPTPKSKEQLKQEYIETTADLEKYKIYEEKKLNLHIKKNDRPPVIVEDNLSKPSDDKKEIRATIKKVEFTPSEVFTEEELQKLAAPLLSQPVTIDDIKKVVDGITRCYILGDYATSKAYLPPQDLSRGVLKIGLFEGKVGKVTVKGNRWTKSGYITSRVAPVPGEVLKVSDLEQDVIKFNNNNTVKLKVGLSASEEPGMTDITLNTEDPFPFHIAFMTDNQGRQTIGTTRWGGMIAADSLFGHRDRLSLGGYLGRGNRVGFADYNMPINKYGTRIGASVSAGNISVVNGPLRAFGVGGTSQVYTAYITHPIFDRQGLNISSYTAGNIKRSTTDIAGFDIYEKNTFSVTQGFTARKDTERGIWYTGHYGSFGFKALSGDEDFMKYEGNITRLHDFGHGIVGQFRVSGQYSPDDRLPWMEQFQIGGLSTVRGYSEGLLLGKSGYFASAEIMTPLPFLPKAIGSDRLGYIYPREMIRGAVFVDNGMVFPYKADGSGIDGGDFLTSFGIGLRVNLSRDLAARFYWGWPLANNRYEMDRKMGRFHFEITCAPDFGRLVETRNPAPKKHKKEAL